MRSDDLRRALCDGDIEGCFRFWSAEFPNMPQPNSRADRETIMHQARTSAQSVPVAKRVYSHRWLEERNKRSLLPDELRPRKPEICAAVGVSVNTTSRCADRIAQAKALEKLMAAAAGDAMLSGITDPMKIKEIMQAVRNGRGWV